MVEALKNTVAGNTRVQNAERRQTERMARNIERRAIDQTEREDQEQVQNDRDARLDHSEPGGT